MKAAILSLLAEEPHNGYRLIKAIARMTDGAWRPSPGSVYPTLQQMLEEGLIAAVGGEGNRSDYGLTDEGRSYVAEHVEDLKAAWEAASGTTDEDLAMQDSIRKLTGAVHQAALAATEEQSGKIAEILDDARRAVYRVLAD
ncbi:PadR family transcriptional regulator [Antricoccus suffuscus]|uniref:PadR family transcriptional regulator n=1 Tax=Antricoccus suffuscus TaxID=1629062 RepID=A0A2T0ZYB0_9ACTN|nr:PadR family transcriptional regulator [Antricoccus suffuscus]